MKQEYPTSHQSASSQFRPVMRPGSRPGAQSRLPTQSPPTTCLTHAPLVPSNLYLTLGRMEVNAVNALRQLVRLRNARQKLEEEEMGGRIEMENKVVQAPETMS
eukprot:765375-Hanusia_phi.AAC.4